MECCKVLFLTGIKASVLNNNAVAVVNNEVSLCEELNECVHQEHTETRCKVRFFKGERRQVGDLDKPDCYDFGEGMCCLENFIGPVCSCHFDEMVVLSQKRKSLEMKGEIISNTDIMSGRTPTTLC